MTAEERDGVRLTSLDDELFGGAGVTKRQLVDYVEAATDRLIPTLVGRPLSVVRTTGPRPYMQKQVPKGTPDFVRTVDVWAETSQRTVSYAVVDDDHDGRRTLLWLANQRAVEVHPTLGRLPDWWRATDLVLDLDPPESAGDDPDAAFGAARAAAHLVRSVLDDLGLASVVKTSGAKGVHVFVPLADDEGPAPEGPSPDVPSPDDVAAATRAIAARAAALDPAIATTAFIKADRGGRVFIDPTRAGGATVVAADSARVRPGVPVSFPLEWDELDDVVPSQFTVLTAPGAWAGRRTWGDMRAAAGGATLPTDLIAEGHELPIPRVQAMHEGKRRKRAGGERAGD